MASRRDRRPESLVLDPGVLREGPVCEFHSDLAVEAQGGTVVQPWRDRFRAAEIAGLEVVPNADGLRDAEFPQVIVHLQKSRASTFSDLASAWRLLESGGQLLLAGSNSLGIVSAAKRLGAQLGQSGIVVANRARSRIVRYKKDAGAGPVTEAGSSLSARVQSIQGDVFEFDLDLSPGVFSAKRIDAGSQLLLDALPRFVGHKPPKRIVDLGCGSGVFGIAAARLWPEAEILLADADARAVRCATHNVERLGLASRCRVVWWDAREPPVANRFQLALVNPPFHHRGPEVDLAPAFALFASLPGWTKPGARALLVANQTLPYEAPLSDVGDVKILDSARGYKLLSLSLSRSSRSSASKRRNAPGSRPSGRTKRPIRSR